MIRLLAGPMTGSLALSGRLGMHGVAESGSLAKDSFRYV